MNKQKIFSVLNRIGTTSFLRTQKAGKLTVLSLHRVSFERDYFFNPITPNHFEQLLQYVTKHYQVVSFLELESVLAEKKTIKKPLLILSFDDGYYDFIEFALPLLSKYKLPCNHNIVNSCATKNEIIWTQRLNHVFNFVKENNLKIEFQFENNPPLSLQNFENNWMAFYIAVFKQMLAMPMFQRLKIISEKEKKYSIESKYRMMNWDEIMECSQNNVEIGSHTFNHDVLSSIPDLSVLRKEIVDSKIEIEKKTNKKISILALPNGQSNENILSICNEAAMDKILFVGDKLTTINDLKNNIANNYYRISMMDESLDEMALRTEMFHSKFRKNG